MNCIKCGKQATVFVKSEGGAYCRDCYEALLKEIGKKTQSCPSCGTSLEKYRRTGIVGCENCYFAFYDEIMPAVRTLQGRTEHVGKEPVTQHRDYSVIIRRMELKEAIEVAMKEQRYHDASQLRKELGALNSSGESI